MFRAELIGSEEASWEELFAGYTALKAITFSSSVEMLLRLADRLADMEVVFGSESILSKEHLALAQASQTIQSYGFSDALIDQKALVEALVPSPRARWHQAARAGGRLAPCAFACCAGGPATRSSTSCPARSVIAC